MFLPNDAYETINETYIFAKYRFRAIFYILVCPNRTIFKESMKPKNDQHSTGHLKKCPYQS